MLADPGAIVGDQLVDRRIVGAGRHVGQGDVALEHGVGPEVIAGDVQCRPWGASQIDVLGPVGRDRHPDDVVVADDVQDVRQLRPAVGADGGEHRLGRGAGELEGGGQVHGPCNAGGAANVPVASGRCSASGTTSSGAT